MDKISNTKYQMSKRKSVYILVTGGAGYIGSFTVRELLASGYEVVVLDSLENGHKEALQVAAKGFDEKQLILEVGNVGDKDKVREIFDKYQIEAVIDFAAYLAVGESMENPQKYLKNNVVNFVNLLDVMREKGCQFIIKSSTASTYGNPEDKYFPLSEEYQEQVRFAQSELLEGKWDGREVLGDEFFNLFMEAYREAFHGRTDLELNQEELDKLKITTSIYGLTKLLDEILMVKYDRVYGVKGVALRYFNVCGASLDGEMGDDKPVPTNLMTLVILNVLGKTDKLKVFGDDYPTKDGTGIRDYIHPIDLGRGHVKALEYLLREKCSSVFNLGTGNGYTVMEVISEVEKASGFKVSYEVVGRRSGDPAESYASADKANQLLDWKAQYGLADMAKTAWKWHKMYPEGYRVRNKG